MRGNHAPVKNGRILKPSLNPFLLPLAPSAAQIGGIHPRHGFHRCLRPGGMTQNVCKDAKPAHSTLSRYSTVTAKPATTEPSQKLIH